MVLETEENGSSENLVPCSNCNRKFAQERIEVHTKICTNSKHREVYDVAMARVAGTEAEELVKAGKLQLEKAKPLEKKSALHHKLQQSNLNKTILPPINRKPSPKKAKSTAYAVTFDGNDQIKTRKNTKFMKPLSISKNFRNTTDDRYCK